MEGCGKRLVLALLAECLLRVVAAKAWDEVFVDGVLEISCVTPLTSQDEVGTWIESHL